MAGITVVGEASDGKEAISVIKGEKPDVVLLDLRVPRFDGLWTLGQLRSEGIEVASLVLTTFNEDSLVLDALREGARGYLLKDVTLEQLAAAVHTLADGGTIIAPSITDRLLKALRADGGPLLGS